MDVAQAIKTKLNQALIIKHLELFNESHMHAGPVQDSHFKLIAVSDDFSELSLVKRHQKVYRLLEVELAGPIHALSLHLYTEEEWQQKTSSLPASPNCLGGE